MANRTIPRRKTRKTAKPRTITVGGVDLSQSEYELFQRNLEGRAGLIVRAEGDARQLALQDTLYAKRATTKAMDRIEPLSHKVLSVTETLASMRHFRFTPKDPKLTELGNAVIRHCSEELFAVVMELNSIHEGIAKQMEEVAHG